MKRQTKRMGENKDDGGCFDVYVNKRKCNQAQIVSGYLVSCQAEKIASDLIRMTDSLPR